MSKIYFHFDHMEFILKKEIVFIVLYEMISLNQLVLINHCCLLFYPSFYQKKFMILSHIDDDNINNNCIAE